MKMSVCKFRRRWEAAQCAPSRSQRERKMAHLVALFDAEPVVLDESRPPIAYRLPSGDVFCVKKRYATRIDAAEALARIRRDPCRREQSLYPCHVCHGFHLSSKPNHQLADLPWQQAAPMLTLEAETAR